MKATILSLGALAVGASAWTYPDCEPDNCYREMTDPRFYGEAVSFCPGYLAGATADIPSDFENCGGDSTKVSSACSCITYSASTTTTPSTYAPSSTEPVYPTTTSSYPPVYPTTSSQPSVYLYPTPSEKTAYPTYAPPGYTISVVYSTTCYTVSTAGPKYVTTVTYPAYTTLCPVQTTLSHTSTSTPPPRSTYSAVQAGAAHVDGALGAVAGAALALAALI